MSKQKTINYHGTTIIVTRHITRFGLLFTAQIDGEPWTGDPMAYDDEEQAIFECVKVIDE